MEIYINSNNSLEIDTKLRTWAEGEVESALAHYKGRITRVEVHLNDENSGKGGESDKYCSLEARVKGLKSMATNHKASSFDLALAGAAEKLETVLAHRIGKLDHKKGRTPMGGEPYSELSDQTPDRSPI